MSLTALFDLPAPAKLNLFLHVIGRRPDGYHLLQSVFVLVDWCDTLHIERRHDARLLRHDLGPALPPDDLCLKAAAALQRESGCTFGADISIDKRVPWGAGLGGGSSDAATVLIALNRLWRLNWDKERLIALGARLGADVPFFLGGHNAFVEGIGDRLTPLAVAPEWFAIVKPAASLATATIFGNARLTRDTEPVILSGFVAGTENAEDRSFSSGSWVNWLGHNGFGRNDLQATAEALCPDVVEAGRWLDMRYGNSRMTGSGSAVFARAGAGDQPVATWQAGEIPPGWVGHLCQSLVSHPLAGWTD